LEEIAMPAEDNRAGARKRRINVSPKRQITIPMQFYKELGVDAEVDCFVKEGALIIEPVREAPGGTFGVEILRDLVKQGLAGNELVARFEAASRQVRPAVETMIREADQMGQGKQSDGEAKFNEIFRSGQ
jgi:hypothetical protein